MRSVLFPILLSVAGIASAETSPEATTDALWHALSHGPDAGADAARLGEIFHRDARVYGVRHADGTSSLVVRGAAEWIARQAKVDAEGFHEREVFREVRAYGDFAQVFATVESRTDPATPKPNFTGINSVHLYRENGAWRIVALYYGLEVAAEPLPEQWRGAK